MHATLCCTSAIHCNASRLCRACYFHTIVKSMFRVPKFTAMWVMWVVMWVLAQGGHKHMQVGRHVSICPTPPPDSGRVRVRPPKIQPNPTAGTASYVPIVHRKSNTTINYTAFCYTWVTCLSHGKVPHSSIVDCGTGGPLLSEGRFDHQPLSRETRSRHSSDQPYYGGAIWSEYFPVEADKWF